MQTSNPLVYPDYFRVVEREPGVWHFYKTTVFYNPGDTPIDTNDKEMRYGLTRAKLAIELFRINGGKSGWYLANLRDRQYYYCGEAQEDVKTTLLKLGIGQLDPISG